MDSEQWTRPSVASAGNASRERGPRPLSTVTRPLDLALLAALAVIANFLYLYFSNGDYFYPDSATYLQPAKNLLHGLGFVTEPGFAETLRTPGYPLFLLPFLAITNSAVPVLIVQHLMNVALTIAIYLTAMRLTASRFVAIAAAVIFAIDVPSIHHANRILTEAPFTVLLFLVFLLAWRLPANPTLWRVAAVGLLAGALVLVRPVAIVYFAVLAVVLAPKLRARATAIVIISGAILPLAWAIRNRIETGVMTLTSVSGNSMLTYRAAGALAILDDYDFAEALADRQNELSDQANDEIARRERVKDADEVDPALRGRYYGEIGRRIALQHPAGLALVTLRGLLINLFDSNWGALANVSGVPPSIIELTLSAWTAVVFALACAGAIALFRIDRRFAVLLAATIAYFLLISAGGESEARFRVPVMPLIAIAAATGLQRISRRV